MSFQLALVLLLATLPARGSAANYLEIIVPGPQTSTTSPRVSIVGRTDASQVTVSLNGNLVATKAVTDSIFHCKVWLPFGLNKVTVEAVSLPAADSLQVDPPGDSFPGSLASVLEILCGPRISRDYEKIYQASSFHSTKVHEACLGCHDGQMESQNGGEDAAWCLSCHSGIREKFKTHQTKDEKVCTNCHRMNADLTKERTGIYTDMNPCFLCHKDKIGEFAQDYIHGPVAGGTCTVCHDPHGSEFDANLRSPVPVLCLFCHTSMDEMVDPVQHKPFRDGKCVICHDAHATGNRWVLTKSSGELCLDCHREDVVPGNHRHPIDRKPNNRLETNLTLTDRGRLECLSCHHPHTGKASYLLRSDGLNGCIGCHKEHQ